MQRHRIHKSLIVAAALALPVSGSALAGTKVYRALDGDRVMVITYGGKPPYSHRVVKVKDLSAAELERFKRTNADSTPGRGKVGEKVGEKIRVVDRSGKPPFTQQVVTVTEENAAEFARFEETPPDAANPGLKPGDKLRIIDRSGKPPFSQRVITVTEENAAELGRSADEVRAPQ
jgi:hypothetical protein